jgi:hypothetical protein
MWDVSPWHPCSVKKYAVLRYSVLEKRLAISLFKTQDGLLTLVPMLRSPGPSSLIRLLKYRLKVRMRHFIILKSHNQSDFFAAVGLFNQI